MQVQVKTIDAQEAGTLDLDEAIYGVEPRADILQRVVVWQLAKRRAGTHKTKSRGEVSYSTKKLFKQKGTGRARHGDRGVNIFRKGGTVHGPTPRDHSIELPKKVRKLGLKMALSAKVRDGKLLVIESSEMPEAKTKTLAGHLLKHGVTSALVVDGSAVNETFRRASRNIPMIDSVPAIGANVHDILRHETLILTRAAVDSLRERLA